MRLRFVGLMGLAAAVAATVVMHAGTREALHWRWSALHGSPAAYERYLASWPDGRHADRARQAIEDHAWEAARTADTPESLTRHLEGHPESVYAPEAGERLEQVRWTTAVDTGTVASYTEYLAAHADGGHAPEARERLEALHWDAAETAGTIVSYQAYQDTYPTGLFASDARTRAAALRVDDAPYTRAAAQGTRQAIEAFLRDFPGHQRTAAARAALADIDGRDIVDLIREGKIEVQPSDSGIQNVSLRIRRLVPYPLTVRVPVGTFFVAGNRSSQNMVATARNELRLTSTDWMTVSVAAACANRPRNIPGSRDTFTIQRAPEQADLTRLLPVLEQAGASFAVKQAATWIVTDDASYSALGVLVRGSARVIREPDAARAMQLYEQAGLNITTRAIWRDRQSILRALPDGALKTWLQAKE